MKTLQNIKDKKQYMFYFILLILSILICLDRINMKIDDVYISLRYVENIISGFGPVFNQGERLEAISNPTWVWVVSIISIIFNIKDQFYIIYLTKILGVTFFVLSSFLLFSIILNITENNILSFFCTLIYVLNPFIAAYSISGLENSLVYFLLLASLYFFNLFLLNKKSLNIIYTGLFIGLLTISRPEGIIYFVCYLIAIVFYNVKTFEQINIKFVILSAILPLSIYILFVVWRVYYYGEYMPNTAYAKNSPSLINFLSGFKYFISFIVYNVSLFIGYIILAKNTVIRDISIKNLILAVFCINILLIQVLFVTYAGGDWMPGFRLLLILIPIVIILFSIVLNKSFILKTLFYSIISISILSNLIIGRDMLRNYQEMDSGLSFKKYQYLPESYLDLAMNLKKISKPGELALIGEAGVIPYFNSQLRFVDVFGLADKYVAKQLKGNHFERSNPEYFMKMNCDYFIYLGGNKEIIKNALEDIYNPSISTGLIPIDNIIYHKEFQKKYKAVYSNSNGIIFINRANAKQN